MHVPVRVRLLVGPDAGLVVRERLERDAAGGRGDQIGLAERPDLALGEGAEAERRVENPDLPLRGVRIGSREDRLLVRPAEPDSAGRRSRSPRACSGDAR
jgi:hypothetical protein